MPELENPIPLSYGNGGLAAAQPEEGIRVTLPDVSSLKGLPKSGEITFRYCRDELRLNKNGELLADIRLCELCGIEPDEEVSEKEDDIVDKLYEEAEKTEQATD